MCYRVCVFAERGADRVCIWSKRGCSQRSIMKDISHYQQRQMTWVSYFVPVFAHMHNFSPRQPFVCTALHRDPLFTRPALNRLTSAETSYFQAAETYPGPQRQRRQDGKIYTGKYICLSRKCILIQLKLICPHVSGNLVKVSLHLLSFVL